jgi:hypothetical protein
VLYCGAATRDNTLWRTTHVAATRGALHIVSISHPLKGKEAVLWVRTKKRMASMRIDKVVVQPIPYMWW